MQATDPLLATKKPAVAGFVCLGYAAWKHAHYEGDIYAKILLALG